MASSVRPTGKGPAADTPLGKLLGAPIRAGELLWIGVRPQRRASLQPLARALLVAGRGIEGDHYETRRDGARQVTLIASEDIAAIASFLGQEAVPPELLRRNLVTRGMNILALKGRRFRIGAVLLEASGDCAPCSRMEEVFGVGGYNAVRGRGGITARILSSGAIHISDPIVRVDDATP
ncbi:MAG: MOSC domain-containing protein [Hyphomicrobium sp.]